MKGRPNIYQDEELILKAQQLFWKKGYSATSLSELSLATGAGAGSLYNIFKGGKRELFIKSLNQRRKDFLVFSELITSSENPIDQIKKFFRDVASADQTAHQKGCIIANTLVEMAFVDEELKDEAANILKKTEELYRDVIAREQEKGNLRTEIPADTLAKNLIVFWCGINSLRRIYPDKTTLLAQVNMQLSILH